MLKVLDLFSGIGGMSIGLERTGKFQTIAFCEIDPYASKVLQRHWPHVPNLGDITKAEFPDADFICAGFPCQDISFAGSGAGIAGTRSGLWREVVRAIRMVRPRGALLENVAALLSRGLDTVLGDLAEIGHDAEWHCIPASAVGAPHIRDRIWIYTKPQRADADSFGSHRAQEPGRAAKQGDEQECLSGPLGEILANANRKRKPQPQGAIQKQRRRACNSGEDVADAGCLNGEGIVSSLTDKKEREVAGERPPGSCSDGVGWWAVEPQLGRVANGIPNRSHRLRALGNAVVPQVVELIGRAILASQMKGQSK